MTQKTPISSMNELCKSNNIVPDYQLVEEAGPPHQRSFKVELSLPNGSYFGVGQTIKNAKHEAAQSGLDSCGLTKPERKVKPMNIAPSVELNNLAMKLGKQVIYTDFALDTRQHPGPTPAPSNAYPQYGGQLNKPYPSGFQSYSNSPTKVTVSLKIGDKEYFGEGNRIKDARHNAAQNALPDLRAELNMDMKLENDPLNENPVGGVKMDAVGEPQVKTESVVKPSANPIKSAISLVYEIASKRKMKLVFEVVSSSGPPHNRLFVTSVTVDNLNAMGEGSGKKASKHAASMKILEELNKLPPLPVKSTYNPKGRLYNHGGYGKKSLKELDPSLNPISLLGQLRQRRKESLPVYTLVGEEGIRNKEFTMQVEVDSHTARGSGANKKEAKMNAAEAMLQLLGIRPNSGAMADSGNSDVHEKNQKQNQDEEKTGAKEHGSEGRQLPPGLLPILPEMASRPMTNQPQTKHLTNHSQQIGPTVTVLNRAPGAPVGKPISDEILQNGSTPSMKKLQQLAESGGFQVQYQDTTKENNEQCLAVVTISTVPPLICRGYGPTLDQAFEHAAANALVPLLQPPGPPNGSVMDHLGEKGSSKAPGARNILVGASAVKEEPTSGKPIV